MLNFVEFLSSSDEEFGDTQATYYGGKTINEKREEAEEEEEEFLGMRSKETKKPRTSQRTRQDQMKKKETVSIVKQLNNQ